MTMPSHRVIGHVDQLKSMIEGIDTSPEVRKALLMESMLSMVAVSQSVLGVRANEVSELLAIACSEAGVGLLDLQDHYLPESFAPEAAESDDAAETADTSALEQTASDAQLKAEQDAPSDSEVAADIVDDNADAVEAQDTSSPEANADVGLTQQTGYPAPSLADAVQDTAAQVTNSVSNIVHETANSFEDMASQKIEERFN